MNVALRSLLMLVLGLLGPVAAAQPAKPKAPTDAELRQAARDLADERFPVRQRAFKLLWSAGDAAEKYLRDAANSGDPEVVRQARLLLDRIAYRIEPDTPADVVDLMQRFRNAAGLASVQSQAIRDMLQLGGKAHRSLLRMLDTVEDKQRRLILDEFAYDDWKVLAALMADGQEALVEQLLEKVLAAQNESIVPHYAAFQSLTGRLDARIAEYRARVEQSNLAFDARVLLALDQIKGDREGALWAARRAQHQRAVQQVLMEMGRWEELLADKPLEARAGLGQVAALGYHAAYQRLAGRDADFQSTIQRVIAYADERGAGRNARPWYAAKVLLVNERPAEALELLTRHNVNDILIDLLVAQARYREALERSERTAQAESGAHYADRIRHIDLLLRVGHTARAREWLQKLTQDMGDSTDPGWLDRLSAFQVRLGERAEVQKRLVGRLERRDGSALGPMFAALYPRLDTRAETLLELLRMKRQEEDNARLLARIEQIEEGKTPPNELADLFKHGVPVNRNTNQGQFDAVAQLVELLELPDVAAALLVHPGWDKASADAKLYLADTLAAAGRWPAAADAYHAVWEQDRSAPLPLFLHGQALLRVNPADSRAKALIERSHRVPLGGESARYNFHVALSVRGFNDDSLREVEFCSKLHDGSSWTLGSSLDHLANMLAARGDFFAAAAIQERNVLRVIPTSAGFRWPTAYSRVTADIHLLRARGLLAQGKRTEALAELHRAEQLHPANVELAIGLVPALEKAGEKPQADQLYERLAALWRQACNDYPDCAQAHNRLAWLCARCRRDLDAGVAHARKAIELAPRDPSYRDTLAELLFQKGQKQAAIDMITKCLKLPGANTGFYRRQLARFQAGDPGVEPAEQ